MLSPFNIEVLRNGFAFLPQFRRAESTSRILSHLGEVERLPDVDEVQRFTPKLASVAPPNIYSGTFGLGAFPLHTDLAHWHVPPRYFALRCVRGSPHVKTTMFDGHVLME